MDIKSFVNDLDRLPNLIVPESVKHVHEEVVGYSSPCVMTLINMAVGKLGDGEVYLEVGVLRGKTLIGALVGNEADAIAVESFEWEKEAFPDPGSFLIDNMRKFNVTERVEFFNLDFRDFFTGNSTKKKVGVYFFDAYSHDFDVCLAGLEMVVPFLADSAVIFVDEASSVEIWHAVVNFCHNHIKETAMLFSIATPDFPFRFNSNWFNGLFAIGWKRIVAGEIHKDTLIK